MSNFGSLGLVTEGLPGTAPQIFVASTADDLATITASGYLDDQSSRIKQNDVFYINYLDTSVFPLNTGEAATLGEFYVNYSGGHWSLISALTALGTAAAKNASDNTKSTVASVNAATVLNHIMVSTDTAGTVGNLAGTAIQGGSLQAGLSGTAGTLISFPATGAKGSFIIAAVANTGNTNTTLSNVPMGQATVVSISDPGAATGYLNTSTINASLTPLATSGHVAIITGSGAMQFKVRDIKVNYSASGLSGGGGDRLVTVTDGTSIYNNAGITAALLGTPVNTVWGGSGNPLPGTVALNTSTVAGSSLYAVYSGGAADYTTGTVNITVSLERVA